MYAKIVFLTLILILGASYAKISIAKAGTMTNAKVTAKDNRLLGFGINNGNIGFEKAIEVAKKTGFQVIELPVQWDDIEKKPEKYKNQWLNIANSYYPAIGVKILISFNPIDTNSLRMPSDLIGKPFDDPEVIARYNKAASYVLNQMKDSDLIGFVIGNEIDGILGNDPKKWRQYTNFFKATSEHIRKKRPGITVGTKVMFDSLIGSNAERSATINAHADAIMLTYYPLGNKFQIKDIASINQDLEKLATLPGSKPIFIAEIGCPSSEEINSSTSKQSQFITTVFNFWDKHNKRVKFINFIWLHDVSSAEVKSYKKYYGLSSKGFAEFLGTLGLHKHNGQAKPAFNTLVNESQKRGW